MIPKHEHANPRPARASAIPRRRFLLAVAVAATLLASGCEWPLWLADNPVAVAALGGGSVTGRAPNVVPDDGDGDGGVLVDRVYVEARARRGADGAVEVGARVNATGLAWTPERRLFDYNATPVGEWWTSSPIGPADAGVSTVRIRARRLDSGHIELALLTPTGVEVTPRDPHIAYADLTDSDWAYTTPVVLTATGEPAPLPSPASTATHGGFVEISTTDAEGCGMRRDGTVECWGSTRPLPTGSYVAISVPCALRAAGDIACGRPVGEDAERLGPFIALSGGLPYCGIRPDGRIDCWRNLSLYDEQFGGALPPAGAFAAVSVGNRHACGIRLDSTVACWGNNRVVVLSGSVIGFSDVFSGQARPPEGRFAAVSVGGQHTCAIRLNGTVECWGDNDGGQSNPPPGRFGAIFAGGEVWFEQPDYTCGLRPDGRAECWGGRRFLQDEHFAHAPPPAPTGVFAALSGGGAMVCGLRLDGTVDCWWPAEGKAERRTHIDLAKEPHESRTRTTLSLTHVPGGSFETLSVGGRHACGLRASGRIACWGNDMHGQADPPAGRFSGITVGGYHTCALDTAGRISCWGDDTHGQTAAPPGRYRAVSAGWQHACALRSDGEVSCWGDDTHGQTAAPPGRHTAITAGGRHTCALDTAGRISCWGDDTHGQTAAPPGRYTAITAGALQTCSIRHDGAAVCWGTDGTGQASRPGDSFTHLSAGSDYTCGLHPDGDVECWSDAVADATAVDGANEYKGATPPAGPFVALSAGARIACGLRGDATAECWIATGPRGTNTPPGHITARSPQGTFRALSAGTNHTCALDTDGNIDCWGDDTLAQATPPADALYDQLAAGDHHTCALDTDGNIDCWGENTFGQTVAPAGRYRSLAGGAYHACALDTDGHIDCWGDDTHGQANPPSSGRYTAITAGEQHTCALDTDRHIDCWGGNDLNQANPPADGRYSTLAAGRFHTCALRTDGNVDCWGLGYDHDDSNPHDRDVPTMPPKGPFTALTAGARHTCALDTSGAAFCWPHEGSEGGEYLFGDGDRFHWHAWNDSRATPLPGPFTAISAGSHHTCGIRPDGTVDCWSANEPREPQDAVGTSEATPQ